MTSKKIKLYMIALFAAAFIAYAMNAGRAIAFSGGPPNGMTGAPGEMTCAVMGCHSTSAVNSGPGTLTLTGLPANFSPGQEIPLTVTLAQTNRTFYGFELTVIDDAGKKAGDLVVTEPQRTQKSSENITGTVREYLSHQFSGITPNGTNQNQWTFRWKAPSQPTGHVTFYVAGNAANGNGTTSGDFIYTINASTEPAVLAAMANVSAASFAANAPLAAESIAAAFGTGMSNATVVATTQPLPIELDGTQVLVRDLIGIDRPAPLFFVSPGQINYLVPAGLLAGEATVTVRRNASDIAQGKMTIERTAPGLFAANANGQGVAAAVVFRRKASGEETFESVAQLNATTNRFEAVSIDVGSESDQVFLILYGTAFRNRSSLAAVNCAIGGINSEVTFAGAVEGLAGLDQANIRLPHTLAGRGTVDVVFNADNQPANTVTINIK